MDTIEIKNNFHRLIDSIDNDTILSRFYKLLEKASTRQDGMLWNQLSDYEQQELMRIDIETDNEGNIIPHSIIMAKHKKWLKK